MRSGNILYGLLTKLTYTEWLIFSLSVPGARILFTKPNFVIAEGDPLTFQFRVENNCTDLDTGTRTKIAVRSERPGHDTPRTRCIFRGLMNQGDQQYSCKCIDYFCTAQLGSANRSDNAKWTLLPSDKKIQVPDTLNISVTCKYRICRVNLLDDLLLHHIKNR